MQNKLSVLQISDPHFFADEQQTWLGINTTDSFKAVLASIAEEADYVFLTGDLCQDKTIAGYRRLHQLLSARVDPEKIITVPGNHDDAGFLRSIFRTPSRLVAAGWKFIFLNTQIPGAIAGLLSPSELAILKKELNDQPELPTMIFMHHPPIAVGSAWLDPHQLKNGDDFFKAVQGHPSVQAVCVGHIHQQFESSHNGIAVLSVPSTCYQFKPKRTEFAVDDIAPGYRRFEFLSSGTFKTEVIRVKNYQGRVDLLSKGY